MARLFDDGSTEYLTYTGNCGISAYPFTLAAWFYSDDSSPTNQAIIGVRATSTNDGLNVLRLRDPADTDLIALSSNVTDGSGFVGSFGNWSTNTWHHACGRFTNTDRTVHLDGDAGSTDGINVALGTINVVGIGYQGGGTDFPMSGRIADAAIWNVSLSVAEVQSLAAGFSPLFIRPASLVAYWPLFRDDNDRIGGFNMTPINTPSWADHPRIIMPTQTFYSFPMAAASGWSHKIAGISSPGKVSGIASPGKIGGV